MIASISGLLNLNNLDMTSDANDVIVVRHPDGRMHSTPFNVRFGKVKVLSPGDKVVLVEVNGVMTSAVMKMGPDGEAFWLSPTGADMAARPESPVLPPQAPAGPREDAPPPAAPLPPPRAEEAHSDAPLIEEDRDGHLKVSAGARYSLKDAEEVDLAEETVEAAERAMRCVARMSFEDDEYLREMALQDDAPASVTCFSSAFKSIEEMAEASKGGTSSMTACAVSMDITGKEEIQQNTQPSVPLKKCGNGVKCDDEKLTEKLTNPEALEGDGDAHRNILTTGGAVQDKASDAISDALSDALKDDYIFEDAVGNVDPEMYNFEWELANCDAQIEGIMETLPANTASGASGFAEGCEEGFTHGDMNVVDHEKTYFVRSLIPIEADLQKLNLQEGHNQVRYITHSSLRGEVAVEASIYLWKSTDRLVVSDIDGTVTKSDLWGHLMPLFGRDWTHDAICSLYSRIQKNGYRFVYLTARSVSQISMTRRFLWNIEQDGYRLPKGPVLTAPQRFFTALTQEVSKKSHLFKIACLRSVLNTFPPTFRPFYAGFGNRFNDVLSYTAVNIPRHKIFIIDPNSVLHVYNVKQTYKNLTHLVDVTFPPMAHYNARFTGESPSFLSQTATASSVSPEAPSNAEGAGVPTQPNASALPAHGPRANASLAFSASLDSSDLSGGEREAPAEGAGRVSFSGDDVLCDQEFDSFLYWRVPPKVLIAEEKDAVKEEKAEPKRQWLRFSLGSSAKSQGDSSEMDVKNKKNTDVKTKNSQGSQEVSLKEESSTLPVPNDFSATVTMNSMEL